MQAKVKKMGTIGLMAALIAGLAATSAAQAAKTKLFVLAWSAEAGEVSATKKVYDRFMALNPDIRVEVSINSGNYWEKVHTMVMAGAQLDIVWVYPSMAADFFERNYFLNLNPYITRDKVNTKDFVATGIRSFSRDSVIYGLPNTVGTICTYYDIRAFNQAGLPDPYDLSRKGQWTWEAFLNSALRLTKDANGDKKPEYYGIDYYMDMYRWWSWAQSNGAKLADKSYNPTKVSFSEPAAVEAFQFLVDIANKYKVATLNGEAYAAGKAAMHVNQGPWYMPRLRANAKFLPAVAPLPKSKVQTTGLWYDGPEIVRNTKHKEQAWRLLKFLTTDPWAVKTWTEATGRLPVLKSLQKEDYLRKTPPQHPEVFVEALEYGDYIPLSAAFPDIRTMFGNEMNKVLTGKMSVRQAMENVDREGNKLIKRKLDRAK